MTTRLPFDRVRAAIRVHLPEIKSYWREDSTLVLTPDGINRDYRRILISRDSPDSLLVVSYVGDKGIARTIRWIHALHSPGLDQAPAILDAVNYLRSPETFPLVTNLTWVSRPTIPKEER